MLLINPTPRNALSVRWSVGPSHFLPPSIFRFLEKFSDFWKIFRILENFQIFINFWQYFQIFEKISDFRKIFRFSVFQICPENFQICSGNFLICLEKFLICFGKFWDLSGKILRFVRGNFQICPGKFSDFSVIFFGFVRDIFGIFLVFSTVFIYFAIRFLDLLTWWLSFVLDKEFANICFSPNSNLPNIGITFFKMFDKTNLSHIFIFLYIFIGPWCSWGPIYG